MRIIVNEEAVASVGDIIEFNHSGSHGKGSHYLICRCNEGYFIMNLSGMKSGKIRFYETLGALMKFHKGAIKNVYSQTEWNLALTRN